MIRDRDPMGVAGQILEDLFGTAEGWFGIHDPVPIFQIGEERVERGFLGQFQTLPVEDERLIFEGLIQAVEELLAEDVTEFLDW